jgi:hypothetical protein
MDNPNFSFFLKFIFYEKWTTLILGGREIIHYINVWTNSSHLIVVVLSFTPQQMVGCSQNE